MNTPIAPYEDPDANAQYAHRLVLRGLLVSLVFNVGLSLLAFYALATIEISIPPDIAAGVTVERDRKHPTEVYGFAFHVFQQLYLWRNNGAVEYPDKVKQLQHFLTPTYRQWLRQDAGRRSGRGELRGRTRNMQPLNAYAPERARVIADDHTWVIALDFAVREFYRGKSIKDEPFRYYLRVIRDRSDLHRNPWGLVIDGYYQSPEALPKEDSQ